MTDPIIDHGTFTSKAAITFINKNAKGRAFFLSASFWLPTTEGRGFDMPATIEVSKRVATKVVSTTLSKPLEAKGARIKLGTSNNCMFIG